MSAGACAMTVLAAGQQIKANAHFSLGLRFANAVVAYIIYLRQMFWPEGLIVPYDFPDTACRCWR